MPKQLISAALASRLTTDDLHLLCHCWGFKLKDGLIVRATSSDVDRSVALGGAVPSYVNGTYYAETGGDPKASRTSLELSGDSMTVECLLDLGAFPHTGALTRDLRARRFSGAEFWHFAFDWENEDGIIPLSAGVLGNVTLRQGQWIAEVRRLVGHYLNTIGEPYLPECPHTFGGPRCGMRVYAVTHRLYGEMHPVWTTATVVDLRETQDEASNLPTVASLAPFARVTTARPTTYNGRDYVCSDAGTTGGGEPVWPTTLGGTVADGTAEWTAVQARRLEGRITGVTDQRTLVIASERHTTVTGLAVFTPPTTVAAFGSATAAAGDAFYFDADGPEAATRVLSGGATLTLAEPYRGVDPGGPASGTTLQTDTAGVVAIDAPDDWFGAGILEFRTGDNRYRPVEVDTWTLSGTTATLQYGTPETILIGEHVVMHAGCRGRRVDCRDKWGTGTGIELGNMNANGAHYDVPTKLVVFRDSRQTVGDV